jgi:hypothetical protein
MFEEKEKEEIVQQYHGTPRWVGIAVAVLAVVSVAALGIGWNATTRAKSSEQALTPEVQALKRNVEVLTRRLAQAETAHSEVKGELGVVTERLKLTQGELSRARQQAKQIREESQKQLAEMEQSVQSELAEKERALQALSGDVSGVRSDLEAAQSNLQAGLQMARGELGTLIARNSEEIEQLRRLGMRDYFEFELVKKGERKSLGSVVVELRGTNAKRNHFTVALYADDLRLEKKNRSVNEPIYFYVRGYRAPLELVVNQVGKERVVGYLSVPKPAARTAASGL